MKYLYCPKCKELRVKPWYSFKDRCARCHIDVRVMEVPRTVLSYAIYVLMAIAFALVYMNSRGAEDIYLYLAVVIVAVMMVVQWSELSRGQKYARSKIKVTKSDTIAMKEKARR